MSYDALVCKDNKRRGLIHKRLEKEHIQPDSWNGIDYIEIEEDHRVLKVYFLNGTPEHISKENVRIDGGKRIRNIKAVDIKLCPESDPDKDDCMLVTVDKPGDFSIYTLILVKLDQNGRQTDEPLSGFESRYSRLEFSFMAGCPGDIDCRSVSSCPTEIIEEPEINYLAKDYASFRQLILDRLAFKMPGWTERHVPDIGIALVEILAYTGDYLSYYQDAVATEAYLNTARQRTSVRRHVRLVDYPMHEGCNSRTFVQIETNEDLEISSKDVFFITGIDKISIGEAAIAVEDLQAVPLNSYEVFEPVAGNPNEPLMPGDITPGLAERLKSTSDPVSSRIRDELSDDTKKLLEEYEGPDTPFEKLQEALIRDFNRLIQRGKVNRSMLEDIYPDVIAKAQKIRLYEAHNEIPFYTWGDTECCLSKGATSATLKDGTSKEYSAKSRVKLKPGDILILEEKLGPKSGRPEDADITHRCAVRLTKVNPEAVDEIVEGKPTRVPGPIVTDPLTDQPIVEIEWDPDDAILFPLCISSVSSAPECNSIEDASVARGNIVFVDHGTTIRGEIVDGVVSSGPIVSSCNGEDTLAGVQWSMPGRFRPCLKKGPLTFSQPTLAGESAGKILLQDPLRAIPQLTLIGAPPSVSGGISLLWTPLRDLLRCNPEDQKFVAEVDNYGMACIRFGDGVTGKMPEAGTEFMATYRVGLGRSGNVGADAISKIVFRRNLHSGSIEKVRNPMQAAGGMDPEPLEDVKQFAPVAFKKNLMRCITAKDYGEVAERDPRVQRAVAVLNWTGSWFEVQVAIDPFGTENLDGSLRRDIESRLEGYKRIGHDLRVTQANYVPIEIAMDVCVKPDILRENIEAVLMDLFSSRRLSDGSLALFHPDNFTFGDAVYLSKLVAAAQALPGVESLRVTKLERMGMGPKHEIEDGLLPIGSLEIAQMDNDPSLPENGRMMLNLIGGR